MNQALKDKCIHYWICGDDIDGRVSAVCKLCGAATVFKPKFLDGRSTHDFYSPWAGMHLRTQGGTRLLSPRHSGESSGGWDNAVRALEGGVA